MPVVSFALLWSKKFLANPNPNPSSAQIWKSIWPLNKGPIPSSRPDGCRFRHPASRVGAFNPDSPNPGNVCLWNPESRALESAKQLKESGILLTIGIQNPSFTYRDWNPVPRIRNPWRGIQNPRLSWIPLHGVNPELNPFNILFKNPESWPSIK